MMVDITLRNMASIIVYDDNRFLLLNRKSHLFQTAKWIPTAGGHMERDEINNPSKCLWREVQEEIGLSREAFSNVSLRYVTSTLRGRELRHNYYYFGGFSIESPSKLESNEGTLEWKTAEEIPVLDMPESFKSCIMHFIRQGKNTNHIYAANGFIENGKLQYAINEISVAESEIR